MLDEQVRSVDELAPNPVVLYPHLSEPQMAIVPVCYANIFIVNPVPGSKEKGRSDAEDDKAVKSFPPSPRRGGVSKSGTGLRDRLTAARPLRTV